MKTAIKKLIGFCIFIIGLSFQAQAQYKTSVVSP